MEPSLQVHQPSERVRAQARAEGIDLDNLKHEDPARYKMLNATPVAMVHLDLLGMASDVFFAAFRHHDLFQHGGEGGTELRSFPALSPVDFARLDDALGRLTALPGYRERHAYYRVVQDARGERRVLGLPIAPDAWQGQTDVLVGPFPDEAAAGVWGERHVQPPLIADAVPEGGAWFCDVFSGVDG